MSIKGRNGKGQFIKGSSGFKENHSEKTKRKLSKIVKGKKGINARRWKGGRVMRDGYVFIMSPNHPQCNNCGYVREHRLGMEAHIGRVLLPTEIIHHINGIKDDNRIENLMLFGSHREHKKHEGGK